MSTSSIRRPLAIVVALLALTSFAAVGCSSSSKSATAKYCDSWQDLVTAFKGIENVSVTTSGISNLDSTVSNIADAAQKLTSAADELAAPKVSALESSLSALGDLLKAPQVSSAYLGSVTSALSAVDSAWNDLVTTLKTTCPNVSASTV